MATLEQMALVFTPGIGATNCRRLVEVCAPERLFGLGRRELAELLGDRPALVEAIARRTGFERAGRELRFCEQHRIRPLFFTESDYPQRLNRPECADCPPLLYVLGGADLNAEHSVAIVGTRKSTAMGNANAEALVNQMAHLNPTVVSGLAYGIDTAAHRASLAAGVATVAVLGHGLDRIYPAANRGLAASIVEQGGALLTEYPSGTAINPRFFPARNRIIAAMADATVVVEAKEKGGALITAAIAGGYQREVFAVPGRLNDPASAGTNNLIATHKALLIRSADDVAFHLGWPTAAPAAVQTELFPRLSPDQERVRALVAEHQPVQMEQLAPLAGMALPRLAAVLFDLELLKMVHTLPGRLYEVV